MGGIADLFRERGAATGPLYRKDGLLQVEPPVLPGVHRAHAGEAVRPYKVLTAAVVIAPGAVDCPVEPATATGPGR